VGEFEGDGAARTHSSRCAACDCAGYRVPCTVMGFVSPPRPHPRASSLSSLSRRCRCLPCRRTLQSVLILARRRCRHCRCLWSLTLAATRIDESMSAHFYDTVSSWYAFQHNDLTTIISTHASITSHVLKRGKPSIHVFPHLQVAVTNSPSRAAATEHGRKPVRPSLSTTELHLWDMLWDLSHADRRLRQRRLRHIMTHNTPPRA
jgi:hypothetical protein